MYLIHLIHVHSYVTTLCLIGTGLGVILQQDHSFEFFQDEAFRHLWSQPDGVGCSVEHCKSQVSLKGRTSTKNTCFFCHIYLLSQKLDNNQVLRNVFLCFIEF